MKVFMKVAAQGEIIIRRLGPVSKHHRKLKGWSALTLENGRYVIGHSETGHNHVLGCNEGAEVMVMDEPPEGMRVLRAILQNPNTLEHLRNFDTHETLALEPGEYEFRIAREHDHYAKLARQSQD